MDILLLLLLAASVTFNVIMIWYVRKLITRVENDTVELSENIDVFQNNLEQILNTDLVAGEPIVMQLLEDVKTLGLQTESIKKRLLPQAEEEIENND